MMNTPILGPDEGAELKRLMGEHEQATARGREVLRQYGMESPEFAKADQETTALWRRIRELQGKSGQHWSA
jgi:hypothetical protein